MSLKSQNPLFKPHFHHHLTFPQTQIHLNPIKPQLSILQYPNLKTSIQHQNIQFRFPIRAFQSPEGEIHNQQDSNTFNVDAILSIAEILCLGPSAIFTIGCAVNWAFLKKTVFEVSVANKVFVWQFVFLGCAVFVGALIRRRQWGRVYVKSSGVSGLGVNVVDRIEKLEEDLRSSATIIRVMSRQLEKLGIRFRVTRKSLKGPIAETAALAQKNSEATRALVAHEDHLEKELREIQNVLLAMQEQQQKQLELILAVLKAGKPREGKQHEPVTEEAPRQKINSVPDKKTAPKSVGSQIQIEKRLDSERVN